MNIAHLIKMANEISQFFAAYPDRTQAIDDVANHLSRYWDPRMRAQLIAYVRDADGDGLSDIALAAANRLASAPEQ